MYIFSIFIILFCSSVCFSLVTGGTRKRCHREKTCSSGKGREFLPEKKKIFHLIILIKKVCLQTLWCNNNENFA